MQKSKTYKFKFNKGVLALGIIIMIIAVVSLLLSLLKLFSVGNMFSVNVGLDIVGIVIATVIFALVLYVFLFSGFKPEKDYLHFKLFFMSQKIPYENIALLQYSDEQQLAVLYYTTNVEEGINAHLIINIAYPLVEGLGKELRQHNPAIHYIKLDTAS